MELLLIIGPPAVGKMAVGMELAKRTKLKLFHNHMSIEFVQPFFNYGTATGRRLVSEFRRRIFEEVAQSDLPGLIFTYVWAFDIPEEKNYVDSICAPFRERGARVSFVELWADLPTRLARNKTELRLAHKPSKRDLAWSEDNLLKSDREHRLNTLPGEFPYPDDYLRIDNSELSPAETATRIVRHFWKRGEP
jgi:hypothetical protein